MNVLCDSFFEHAKRSPHKVALIVNDTKYSYGELAQKAREIAAQLQSDGQHDVAGIYCTESVTTYASLLAVALTGACYLPLNPRLPAGRLTHMLKLANCSAVLSDNVLPFEYDGRVIRTDVISPKTPELKTVSQPYAYIMFTSGSTGEPKGVPVSWKNLESFFTYYKTHFDFNGDDVFLQPYELSFDVSVFSIFCAWNAGAAVAVVPERGHKYLNIPKVISSCGVTVSSMVPTLLFYLERFLPSFTFSTVRYSFFSGDKLFLRHARAWQDCSPFARIYNCYGPTETTIVCTGYHFQAKRAEMDSVNGIVPLGKPFPGVIALVVDETFRPCDEGELCLSGEQVIDTYLDPKYNTRFFEHDGKRFYRTGDKVRVNERGDLIFLGRIDRQVKVQGYRVELQEVETALVQAGADPAAVIAVHNKALVRLVAFVPGSGDGELALRSQLMARLPHYMVPADIIYLKEIPLGLNGKTDHVALEQLYHEHLNRS